MSNHEYVGSIPVRITPKGKYSVSCPTCNMILEDIMFFLKKCNDQDIKHEENNRYSRVAIIYMAFYIESLSNWLLYEIRKVNNNKLKTFKKISRKNKIKDGMSTIIDNLRIAYGILENNAQISIELDFKGIKDLFMIRNLFAHPPGRSIIAGNVLRDGKGLPEDREPINYEKFQGFPKILSEFTIEHAKIIYNEIKVFLKEYYELISKHFTKDILSPYFCFRELE